MDCRYFITACTNPYRNLAAEELLLHSVKPGQVILYLWQNNHTVVIGRNQDAWRECRADALEKDGGYLARRPSGGGAVYHDMGNQNFTFIARKEDYNVEKNTEVIRRAAARFGIEVERSGRNDILAEGRKFSGNAFLQSQGYCLHHGTILISSNMGKLGEYLNPSPEKLAGKGVASVQARVVNLCQLAPGLTAEAMRPVLIEAFGEVFGAAPQNIAVEALNEAKWDALTEKYTSPAWRLGTPFVYTTHLAARLPFGEIDLQFQLRAGQVEQAKVYSDAMNADWVNAVETALTGVGYQVEELVKALEPLKQQQPRCTQELIEFVQSSFKKVF